MSRHKWDMGFLEQIFGNRRFLSPRYSAAVSWNIRKQGKLAHKHVAPNKVSFGKLMARDSVWMEETLVENQMVNQGFVVGFPKNKMWCRMSAFSACLGFASRAGNVACPNKHGKLGNDISNRPQHQTMMLNPYHIL